MKNYYFNILKCALFHNITEPQLPNLLECLNARIITVRKNQPIFFEGDPAENVGLVLCGTAQIVRDDIYGNRNILAALEPCQMFGEVFACAGTPYLPVSVLATAPCDILLIPCRRILFTCNRACEFHNLLVANLLQIVAQKNLLLNRKIEITSKRSTKQKLMAFLLYEAKSNHSKTFEIPYTRQELADYLGVERSALSAEIGKLRDEGILQSNRKTFILS